MEMKKSHSGSGIVAISRDGKLEDLVQDLLDTVSDYFNTSGCLMVGPQKGHDGAEWYSVIFPQRMPEYRLIEGAKGDSLQARYEETSPVIELKGYVKLAKAMDMSRFSRVSPYADYPVQRSLHNLYEVHMYFKDKRRQDDETQRDRFIDYIRSASA